MSYDKIWVPCDESPGGRHEGKENQGNGAIDEFNQYAGQLYGGDNCMTLTVGKEHLSLLRGAVSAEAFCGNGFRSQESFIDEGNEGYSFDSLSLHIAGEEIATKQAAPSKLVEMAYE